MSKVKVTKLHTLTGHNDCIYVLEKGQCPNRFFSGAGDGMVAQWDLSEPENGRLVAKVKNSIYALHYHVPSESLFVGHNYSGVHKIDLKSFEESASSAVTESAIFDIVSWEDQLLVGTNEGVLISMAIDDLSVNKKVKASAKSLRAMSILPEKGHLAVGYSDNFIRIFDLGTLALLHEFPAHKNSVFSVRYSPCGRYLLSAGRDAHLNIWDVGKNYRFIKGIVAHMYTINHISYSPDGQFMATCSMDKSIKIWDASGFRLLKVIDRARHAGHGTSVNKLYWSGYGNQLVSCSDDRSISVWDIDFAELLNNP